jgi:hypothetical protein
MTADPDARLNAIYLLGALDAGERLAFGVPRLSGLRIASQASGPQPAPAYADPRSRRDETGR